MITRKKLDNDIEKRILIGFITSDSFCNKLLRTTELQFFRNRYLQRVFKWAQNYYAKYEKAPKAHIKNIFETYSLKIPETEAELIQTLLENLSSEYEDISINEKFLIDETNIYFKKRKLEITANNIIVNLDEDNIDEAQKALLDYTSVMPGDDETINPSDNNTINDFFFGMEDEEFLKLPGKLGDFIGNIEPGWLLSLTAKTKGYKSFFLQEFAYAAIHKKIPVIFYSLELTGKTSLKRWYKRIIPSTKNGGKVVYPVWDCKDNQLNICTRKERRGSTKLVGSDGSLPEYSPEIDYRPCDYCKKRFPKEYKIATWYTQIKLPEFEYHDIVNDLKAFNDFYGNLFEIKIFPRYSKSIEDIENHLDILKAVKGFIPRVIIIDYADVLKEDAIPEGYHKEDSVWMKLASLAGKRNAVVITATQTDKAGQTVKQIGIQNTAKWTGKNFHLDVALAINQTSEEKSRKVCRISKILDRHREFNENEQCMVLMNIDAGQINIDSEIFYD